MNAPTIRWLMAVFRSSVYVELYLAGVGLAIASIVPVFVKDVQIRGVSFIFGLCVGIIGIALCYLSGVAYDRINAGLRAAETIERREKEKEEKHARKSKIN